MPHRHYPPAYLRYLKARLWNLGKPSFWVTAIFLSVVGLGIREYWSNPDIFTRKPNNQVNTVKPNNSSLSVEDKAIAADIDNLPAFYSDFEPTTLSPTTNNLQGNSPASKSKNLLQDLLSKQESSKDVKLTPDLGIANSASVPAEQNPFVAQTENLLRFGNVESNSSGINPNNKFSQSTAVTGMGIVNQTDKSQNINPVSPLAAPLSQSSNQTPSNFNNGANLAPPNSLGQTSSVGGLQTPPTNNLPRPDLSPSTELNTRTGYTEPTLPQRSPNPYNNLNNGQAVPNQTQALPVTSPITSTTPTNSAPYSVAPNNIAPYSIQTPIPNIVTPTTPVAPSNPDNFVWQQPTQQPQSNLSVPRQIPGQYGGVQNNGYSYP